MNRDAKTQTALIALARTRRMQRALAHAYIHRDTPLPTLRLSLGYMTSTACTTDDVKGLGHRMTLLGVAPAEGVAYVVEELGEVEREGLATARPIDAPIIYRLWLRGARAGHLVPIHAWYEQTHDAAEIRARIAAIATTLVPASGSTKEAWMLSTRIVQRRALRVAGTDEPPIRKFALQLRVEPVSGVGPSGHTTVTAFLRPGAVLSEVFSVPGENMAIARVTYTGIPSGIGLAKDTMVLLTE